MKFVLVSEELSDELPQQQDPYEVIPCQFVTLVRSLSRVRWELLVRCSFAVVLVAGLDDDIAGLMLVGSSQLSWVLVDVKSIRK